MQAVVELMVDVRRRLRDAEHLLVLPVPFHYQDGRLLVEYQAHIGLRRWLENFASLIVAAPVLPPTVRLTSTIIWSEPSDVMDRIQFVPLPWAYSAVECFRYYGTVRRTLRTCIRSARYLQFAIGGLHGDWAGVAAEEAIALGRRYAVHMDWVAHEVTWRSARSQQPARRIKAWLSTGAMRRWHRRLIRRSSLALCHGADCFTAYAPWCSSHSVPHLIHNLLIEGEDRISADAASMKAAACEGQRPLRVCYAGRIDAMKGPIDWVRAVASAREGGAAIEGIWIGDGPMRPAMEDEIARLRLQNTVSLPGFVADRGRVLELLRDSDLMLFTHLTPESPRCLIEALRCATPIVGYQSAYPADLISEHGGGRLVPMGDVTALGEVLRTLASNRNALRDLICRAYREGERFSSSAVFRHRSELIKRHLGGNPR
jgi:glycosyltransferase involved in cell wall biosynthesis